MIKAKLKFYLRDAIIKKTHNMGNDHQCKIIFYNLLWKEVVDLLSHHLKSVSKLDFTNYSSLMKSFNNNPFPEALQIQKKEGCYNILYNYTICNEFWGVDLDLKALSRKYSTKIVEYSRSDMDYFESTTKTIYLKGKRLLCLEGDQRLWFSDGFGKLKKNLKN